MTFEGMDDDEGEEIVFFYEYVDNLEITGNTWALCGAYDAKSVAYPGFMAQWPLIVVYTNHIRKEGSARLREYTETSVLKYTKTVEEKLRLKAIDLVRGECKMPWGAALNAVIDRHAHIWQDEAEVLVRRSTGQGSAVLRTRDQAERAGGAQGGGKNNGKGGGKAKSKGSKSSGSPETPKKCWGTVKQDKNGTVICKQWNDDRGCKQWCPKKQTHCCDVRLASGKPCLATTHKRCTHDPSKHGAPFDYRTE